MKDNCAAEIVLSVSITITILIMVGLLFLLEGCTTIKHTPYCKCDCKNYTFECSGDVEHEEIKTP